MKTKLGWFFEEPVGHQSTETEHCLVPSASTESALAAGSQLLKSSGGQVIGEEATGNKVESYSVSTVF